MALEREHLNEQIQRYHREALAALGEDFRKRYTESLAKLDNFYQLNNPSLNPSSARNAAGDLDFFYSNFYSRVNICKEEFLLALEALVKFQEALQQYHHTKHPTLEVQQIRIKEEIALYQAWESAIHLISATFRFHSRISWLKGATLRNEPDYDLLSPQQRALAEAQIANIPNNINDLTAIIVKAIQKAELKSKLDDFSRGFQVSKRQINTLSKSLFYKRLGFWVFSPFKALLGLSLAFFPPFLLTGYSLVFLLTTPALPLGIAAMTGALIASIPFMWYGTKMLLKGMLNLLENQAKLSPESTKIDSLKTSLNSAEKAFNHLISHVQRPQAPAALSLTSTATARRRLSFPENAAAAARPAASTTSAALNFINPYLSNSFLYNSGNNTGATAVVTGDSSAPANKM